MPAGNYTLTKKAYDNNGNVTTSNAVKVSVVDYNVPSVVNIIVPVKDTIYAGSATIHLTAKAKDPNDKISKVDFYSGTTLIRTEHYYPYTCRRHNVPGTYRMKAVATDDKGASDTSAPVTKTLTSQDVPIASSRPANAQSKTDVNNAISLKLYPNPANNIVNICEQQKNLNYALATKIRFYSS